MTAGNRKYKVVPLNERQRKSGKGVSMSDFMMSQVKGLLSKVSDDMENLADTNASHAEMLLGAIDDLAANMFATQAIMSCMLKNNPVTTEEAKAWVREQAEAAGQEAPKAEAMVEYLIPGES
jgi:hypothetical protein